MFIDFLPIEQLSKEESQRNGDEISGIRCMKDEEHEVDGVEEMGEVEDLEVAAVADEGHGADDHDRQDGDEGNAGRVSDPLDQAEYS